jgi:hypothetical protein
LDEALPMEAKRYEKNSIGDNDKVDVFSFSAKPGETYFVGVIPSVKHNHYFQLRILDEFRQEMLTQSARVGAGLKSKSFTMEDGGTYFVEISYDGSQSVPYGLVLKKAQPLEGGSATSETEDGPPSS